jgi:chromosome segregation ATPase
MSIKMGATIALDGEKEFRKAISDINTGLRVNASELALVTARYGDNANSVKALTDRQAALGNRITGQRDLIEKLRGALENSIKQYGEADIKTLKWQESLNKAQTDLIGMEGELKDNSEALDKATANMEKYGLKEDEVQGQSKQLGDVLGDVIGQLGINLPAGADKAIRSLDKTKISTAALIGVAAGIVTGFAKATIETSQLADEVLTMSSTTGLATDTYKS